MAKTGTGSNGVHWLIRLAMLPILAYAIAFAGDYLFPGRFISADQIAAAYARVAAAYHIQPPQQGE